MCRRSCCGAGDQIDSAAAAAAAAADYCNAYAARCPIALNDTQAERSRTLLAGRRDSHDAARLYIRLSSLNLSPFFGAAAKSVSLFAAAAVRPDPRAKLLAAAVKWRRRRVCRAALNEQTFSVPANEQRRYPSSGGQS